MMHIHDSIQWLYDCYITNFLFRETSLTTTAVGGQASSLRIYVVRLYNIFSDPLLAEELLYEMHLINSINCFIFQHNVTLFFSYFLIKDTIQGRRRSPPTVSPACRCCLCYCRSPASLACSGWWRGWKVLHTCNDIMLHKKEERKDSSSLVSPFLGRDRSPSYILLR